MRLLTHIVAPEQEGWPLRRLLRQELRISGSFLSRLKWRPGAILVNGRPATVAAVLHTGDAVTADVAELSFKMMQYIVDRITHEVPGVNRVLWDLTPKPTGTIEWE